MFFHVNKRRKPDLALGIDIGASQIKAALIRRQRDTFELLEYAVHALPATPAKAYRGRNSWPNSRRPSTPSRLPSGVPT